MYIVVLVCAWCSKYAYLYPEGVWSKPKERPRNLEINFFFFFFLKITVFENLQTETNLSNQTCGGKTTDCAKKPKSALSYCQEPEPQEQTIGLCTRLFHSYPVYPIVVRLFEFGI